MTEESKSVQRRKAVQRGNLTPEQERDLYEVQRGLYPVVNVPKTHAALSRLRSDLEAATAEVERLRAEKPIKVYFPYENAEKLLREVERLRAEATHVTCDHAAEVVRLTAEVERLRAALLRAEEERWQQSSKEWEYEAEVKRLRDAVAHMEGHSRDVLAENERLREEVNYQAERANRNDRERERLRAYAQSAGAVFDRDYVADLEAFVVEHTGECEGLAEVERLQDLLRKQRNKRKVALRSARDNAAGRRHAEAEVERLQDMHDAAVAKAIENANEVERLRAALERSQRFIHNSHHGNIHSPEDFSFETCDQCRQALQPTKEGE